eukprot:1161556-Pelagomonas_calceolata.AAC.10
MEFCRSTLSAALKAGPLPEEERWHVLRGVLQVTLGLPFVYIDNQGARLHIIDLTKTQSLSITSVHFYFWPDNVFYDAKVRRGNFNNSAKQNQIKLGGACTVMGASAHHCSDAASESTELKA